LKLAHAVRNRWPPIKILVVSGQVRVGQSELPSNSCFVGKPYESKAMIAQLRSLVGLSAS
jgi:two-component system, response regulator PdtaR